MYKKIFAVIILLALLTAGLPAGAFALKDSVDISTLPSLVYDRDATLNSEFGAYNTITIKSGAHVVFKGGFEIAGALVVEPGASLTGVAQAGSFCFALVRDCVVEGLDLWYRHSSGSGETALKKIPQPVTETLNKAGLGTGFKWDTEHACWVLNQVTNIDLQAMVTGVLYHSERDKDISLRFANALKTLGLLSGAGTNADGTTNFALGRKATRAEALTMLIRLLGKESEALEGKWQHPFTDVDAWADPYVGYAYATGLTEGVSATEFGKGNITFQQYMTFLMRALGYTDADAAWSGTLYGDALTYAERGGMFSTENDPYQLCTEDFLRMDMVVASWRVMHWTTKEGVALYERLADQGLFSRENYIDIYLHA